MKFIRRTLIWVAVFTILALVVGISGFIEVKIDFSIIAMAVVAIMLLSIIMTVIEHWLAPKKKVVVRAKVKFRSPSKLMMGTGRYYLHIIIENEIEHKRKTRHQKVHEVDMKIDKKDHPNVFEYCMGIINSTFQKNLEATKARYENDIVIPVEPDIPDNLKQLKEEEVEQA